MFRENFVERKTFRPLQSCVDKSLSKSKNYRPWAEQVPAGFDGRFSLRHSTLLYLHIVLGRTCPQLYYHSEKRHKIAAISITAGNFRC